MKKLIIIFFFIITANIFSQYSIPLRLVNSSGSPLTGQAANIVFTRYPHSYGTDNVSGLTITEIGTAGNYRCKGFTSYEYVKLWLSGVEQTWFDSVQVGSLAGYLLANYMSLNTTQSTSTGSKGTQGAWINQGTWRFYDPRIHTSSSYYPYSPVDGTALIWKALGDSLYGPAGNFFRISSKIHMISGYKLWGLGGTTPISLDGGTLTFTTDVGLKVTNPYHTDSLYIKKDTIIGEATYTKGWGFERDNFNMIDSLYIRGDYYNNYAGTTKSFSLINDAYSKEIEELTGLSTSDAILDTLILPRPGLYQVTSVFTAHFVDNVGASTDSITCSIDDGSVGGSSRLAKSVVTHTYDGTANSGGTVTVTVTCIFTATSQNQVLYLMAKNNQATSSLIHEIWKTQSTWFHVH